MADVDLKLTVLMDILIKKIKLLEEIRDITQKQNDIINKDDKEYFRLTKEKQPKIEEVLKLDDVFNRMFDRIKPDIGEEHKAFIDRIKEKVKIVVDLDVAIRVSEERNNRMVKTAIKRINLPKANNKKAALAYKMQKKN